MSIQARAPLPCAARAVGAAVEAEDDMVVAVRLDELYSKREEAWLTSTADRVEHRPGMPPLPRPGPTGGL